MNVIVANYLCALCNFFYSRFNQKMFPSISPKKNCPHRSIFFIRPEEIDGPETKA